jgi:hypothetical protein
MLRRLLLHSVYLLQAASSAEAESDSTEDRNTNSSTNIECNAHIYEPIDQINTTQKQLSKKRKGFGHDEPVSSQASKYHIGLYRNKCRKVYFSKFFVLVSESSHL